MKRWLFIPIILIFVLCLVFFLNLALAASRPESVEYDVLITNGLIYDGTLKPAFKADIAIKDGRIIRIAPGTKARATRVINAEGLCVSPGFIDMHTHVDRAMYFPEQRAPLSYLTQGVTTTVVGQCGSSAWPIFEKASDQIERFRKEGVGLNVALLVGHGQVRQLVMGMENREPTAEELEQMKKLVKEAMEQGAVGISTGLIYRPGLYAKTDEVLELVKVVASKGGIYHSHIRNERDKLLEAVQEFTYIVEKAGIRGNISHFKVMGKSNWGLVKEACRLIEETRSRGLKITADQYPFRFSNTEPYSPLVPRNVWLGRGEEGSLRTEDLAEVFPHLRDAELLKIYSRLTPYFPLSERHLAFLNGLPRDRFVDLVASEVLDGRIHGPESERERALFFERLNQPEAGQEIREGVKKYLDTAGPENLIMAIAPDKSLEGKSLAEIAVLRHKPAVEVAIELELAGVKAVPFNMCEQDIEYIMKKDYVTTGSDGIVAVYGTGLPHIRSYSTFLYKIKEYALKRKIISLSQAIRSQTSLPAEIMNWPDRGRIAEGYAADIVVLDLKKISVPSSISNPHQFSQGVRHLVINGEIVIDNGNWTGKLAGQVLTLR
jgi:N-acyl-D-amino-acid deacylase